MSTCLFNHSFQCYTKENATNASVLWELQLFKMMWSETFALILVFLSTSVCQTQTQGCGDCCSNTTYTAINEPRRSNKAVWKVGETPFCDRGLRWGWYRFTSYTGGQIPDEKVPENHCGTHAPIWLNGTHPKTGGENVVRQACIHFLGDGCWERFDINITNCGNYFVYYLRPPFYCSVAYCAGEKFVMFFPCLSSDLLVRFI